MIQIEDYPFQQFAYGRYREPVTKSLSPNEFKVYNMTNAGYDIYLIAARIKVAPKYVSEYISRIKQKGWL